jgi:biopolymer transport protein TolR
LPDSKAGALDQEQKPVQISLDPSGAILLDETPVAAGELGARLAQIAASSREEGGPRIFLRADRGLDYGRVMGVMGEINNAGLRKVALVSVSGGEGQ